MFKKIFTVPMKWTMYFTEQVESLPAVFRVCFPVDAHRVVVFAGPGYDGPPKILAYRQSKCAIACMVTLSN